MHRPASALRASTSRRSTPSTQPRRQYSANLALAQTDFEEIERNQCEGRSDLVGDRLAREGNTFWSQETSTRRMCTAAHDSPVPLIDTTIAHANTAVNMTLAEELPGNDER
ncbi:hypothetical protein [Streptomyces hawaiiensis]|uniref:hypothetical protein n=1 Tax=Streptomyces hawaiiensis TaxID=67305 RepID=UPI00364EEA3B